MQNEIVKASNIGDIMNMAEAFAQSGMFPDTQKAAQAFVKIQAGQEIGITPFAAMSGIHIIQGKPTIGAGIMAAKIKGSGKYDYKVLQLDEKACSIDFFKGAEKMGNSTFTAEQAKKAATKNMDKYPANMLFARAISNGLKWFCPDVFTTTVYLREEMEEAEFELHSSKINEPDPTAPAMTDDDKKYRQVVKENDVEIVVELIETAGSSEMLRTFSAINGKFFKAHPDVKDKLIEKGKELKAKETESVNATTTETNEQN